MSLPDDAPNTNYLTGEISGEDLAKLSVTQRKNVRQKV